MSVLRTWSWVFATWLWAASGPALWAQSPLDDPALKDAIKVTLPDLHHAAQYLREGSVTRDRVIAIGHHLWVEGEVQNDAVVVDGSALVAGTVTGDVIVLGGDAFLVGKAKIGGDVYVLGGKIDSAPGVTIDGRAVAYPGASDVWIALISGPTLGQSSDPRLVFGTKLVLLAFWTLVTLLVFGFGRREVLVTSDSIRQRPFHNFFLGLTGVAAMVLTALFVTAFLGALVGLPLIILVAVVALVLRFWGMVAIFHALGSWILRRLTPPLRLKLQSAPIQAATWGLVALGMVKLVPYLGLWTWSLATFIGVGAALQTRLGRFDPWIDT